MLTSLLLLIAVYCVFIEAASLLGGWLPSRMRLTHRRLQLVMSLVAGLMLGVGLLHLLPHSIVVFQGAHAADQAVTWVLVGLLVMFFLLRLFHFHHHGPGEPVEGPHDQGECSHDHGHQHDDDHPHAHHLSWIGVALGLALHTAIDGVALAASVQVDADHGGGFRLFGFGVFLAILLHKPLDAMSITTLMAAGGWSLKARTLVNGGFALMCPLGAALFCLGIHSFEGLQQQIVGAALAFSAGVFLCISLGDLLPEIQFHAHDRIKLSLALLAGIGIAYAIGLVESEHMHAHTPGHNHVKPADVHDHHHDH